jgi:hypothetical protein
MNLTLEFKPAAETNGLRAFDRPLLVKDDAGEIKIGLYTELGFRDYESCEPINAAAYAVVPRNG